VRFAGYAIDASIKEWLWVDAQTPSSQWLADQPFERAPIEVKSPIITLDLALEGAGRIVLPTFVGDNHESLIRATNTIPALSHDQWLVVHQEERNHSDVRLVIDRLF